MKIEFMKSEFRVPEDAPACVEFVNSAQKIEKPITIDLEAIAAFEWESDNVTRITYKSGKIECLLITYEGFKLIYEDAMKDVVINYAKMLPYIFRKKESMKIFISILHFVIDVILGCVATYWYLQYSAVIQKRWKQWRKKSYIRMHTRKNYWLPMCSRGIWLYVDKQHKEIGRVFSMGDKLWMFDLSVLHDIEIPDCNPRQFHYTKADAVHALIENWGEHVYNNRNKENK